MKAILTSSKRRAADYRSRIRALSAGMAASAAFSSGIYAQCQSPNVEGAAAADWSMKVIGALIGRNACYPDKSEFENSDCNIFVGRVLEELYGNKDFVLAGPPAQFRYQVADEIVLSLWTTQSKNWDDLGAVNDQKALDEAQHRASLGKPVIAALREPDPKKHGHVALIGPGPLTPSRTLGVSTPVSASFFQGRPKQNYIGKPLSCAFKVTDAPRAHIFARR